VPEFSFLFLIFHSFDANVVSAKENASGGNLTGLPNVLANKLGCDSNAINSLVCVYLGFFSVTVIEILNSDHS